MFLLRRHRQLGQTPQQHQCRIPHQKVRPFIHGPHANAIATSILRQTAAPENMRDVNNNQQNNQAWSVLIPFFRLLVKVPVQTQPKQKRMPLFGFSPWGSPLRCASGSFFFSSEELVEGARRDQEFQSRLRATRRKTTPAGESSQPVAQNSDRSMGVGHKPRVFFKLHVFPLTDRASLFGTPVFFLRHGQMHCG